MGQESSSNYWRYSHQITEVPMLYLISKLTSTDKIKWRIAIDGNRAPRSTYLYFSCPAATELECNFGLRYAYTINNIGWFWVSKHTQRNFRGTN